MRIINLMPDALDFQAGHIVERLSCVKVREILPRKEGLLPSALAVRRVHRWLGSPQAQPARLFPCLVVPPCSATA